MLLGKKIEVRKPYAYSYLVTSMLITRPKMASHVASTTPTALIARLQLLAYIAHQCIMLPYVSGL
jgi:hypothetical protein